MQSTAMATSDAEKVYKRFSEYNFDDDDDFKAGLRSLNATDDQVIEKAKWFYYSKVIEPFDYQKYTEWKSNMTTSSAEKAGSADILDHPPSLAFSEVVGMLARGEEIPGIREIPDEINTNPPSISTTKAPPKPWEKQ